MFSFRIWLGLRQTVNLQKKIVVSGIIDSHVHLISGGLQVCKLFWDGRIRQVCKVFRDGESIILCYNLTGMSMS
ncbi:hypothetical protein ACS0TY_010831 [Phlomoides rotata]